MTRIRKQALSIILVATLLLAALSSFAMAAEITITQQPVAVKGYKGYTATFSVEAEGEDLEYQWQMRAAAGQPYRDIEGAFCTL